MEHCPEICNYEGSIFIAIAQYSVITLYRYNITVASEACCNTLLHFSRVVGGISISWFFLSSLQDSSLHPPYLNPSWNQEISGMAQKGSLKHYRYAKMLLLRPLLSDSFRNRNHMWATHDSLQLPHIWRTKTLHKPREIISVLTFCKHKKFPKWTKHLEMSIILFWKYLSSEEKSSSQ